MGKETSRGNHGMQMLQLSLVATFLFLWQVKAICYGCPPVFLCPDGSGTEDDILAVSCTFHFKRQLHRNNKDIFTNDTSLILIV